MSTLTANGDGVISARVTFPRAGAWTATVEVNASAIAEGKVEIKSTAFALGLVGTSYRIGAFAARLAYRVVGGKGGLGKNLGSKAYRSVPARIPLGDALTEIGESVSASSDASVLTTTLDRWTRFAGAAGFEIGRLADALSATWRVLDDGTVRFGLATYPDFALNYLVNEDPPGDNRMVISGEDVWKLRPGVTLDGRKIERVELDISSAKTRATAWYQ